MPSQPPFEWLDHTADAGLRARGRTLPELYANAARGLLSLLAEPESVRARIQERIHVEGGDGVDLMVAWLHEILYHFEVRRRVYCDVRIEAFSEWRLDAVLLGEEFDLTRHRLGAEIKAVTYHAARVVRDGENWTADVVLDL